MATVFERIEQRGHPIGLQPQRELELVRRQRLEIVGAVEIRRRVIDPAGTLDEREMLGLGHVARALEHHVLEEVGEARPSRLLVLRADATPEIDGADGDEVVLGDYQAQAVGQALIAVPNATNARRSVPAACSRKTTTNAIWENLISYNVRSIA